MLMSLLLTNDFRSCVLRRRKLIELSLPVPVAPAVSPIGADQLASAISQLRVLVVGGTKGLGAAIAKGIAIRGGDVTVVGRNMDPTLAAECPSVSFVPADLSSMKNAKLVAGRLSATPFNVVVFTTGIFAAKELKRSDEGIEMDFAVSFLSRFVMSQEMLAAGGLTSKDQKNKPRMFVMGFPGTNDELWPLEDLNWDSTDFNNLIAHKNAVLGNDALVRGLSSRQDVVNVFGLSPGIIKTDIMADLLGGKQSRLSKIQKGVLEIIAPSADDYAENTVLNLMVSPELETGRSGASFNQLGEEILSSTWLLPEGRTELLWGASEKLAERALAPESLAKL